ncbi:ABC transporter substrate-binding protein [Roseomonas elaeocarpi]|uniref:ABC transporter substrate-binding protein n=1 Tax=Roseomonas elaeocarpi TaxID=907779 RepID=A0ABV6JMZ8_9PROT
MSQLSSPPRRALGRMALAGAAALVAPLGRPGVARAQDRAKLLRFVPQADLAVLDPVFTTAAVTTAHAEMVFDNLYGLDEQYRPQPQMVQGHTVSDDGLTWTMVLRDGLRFHDNTPVLARDCVASIQRWGARDMYGQEVIARSHEIAAMDDRTLRFRLKQQFPLLPAALGKNGSSVLVIMPERLAKTPATTQVTEMVGSGPYRFLAEERMSGARAAYARFEGYLPRPGGTLSRLAGPKVAHFDRVEWHIIPDQATAASALMAGEVDWLETTSSDIAPIFAGNDALKVRLQEDRFSTILRFNWLQPPFNNPGIRRALLGAVHQQDFMTAGYGSDPTNWFADVGFFTSDSPMASKVALEPLLGPRDFAKVKRDLQAAGYKNERVVLLQADDYPTLKGLAEMAADTLKRAGMNVEVQNGDWGTISTRRANKGSLDQGGWSAFVTGLSNTIDPGGHLGLRANGDKAWFGWPDSAKLEALRQDWLSAGDVAAQHSICEGMQRQAMEDVPYIPLGEYRTLTAHSADLTGFSPGAPLFFGVRRR